jgi:hypothetical protein
MPIWLRRFTFELLKEHYEKQAEQAKAQQNTLNNKTELSITPPDYVTKAPRK